MQLITIALILSDPPNTFNLGNTNKSLPNRNENNYYQGSQSNPSSSNGVPTASDDQFAGDYSAIPGEPDKDYPIFSYVPETTFSCKQQQYPGYYADVETRCQIFHVCANNRTYDFICPNGTIFHQTYLVCVWWNQFDCNQAPSLFEINSQVFDSSRQGVQQTEANRGSEYPYNEKIVGNETNDFKQFYESPKQLLPLSSDQGGYVNTFSSTQFSVGSSKSEIDQQNYLKGGEQQTGKTSVRQQYSNGGSRQQAQSNINSLGYSTQQPAPFLQKFGSQETNFNDLRKYLPPHQNGY